MLPLIYENVDELTIQPLSLTFESPSKLPVDY